jgi:hypothetical protein
MPGATIDHMISVTILITAMLVAMLTFSNMFASAIAYERNRQVAIKAVDLIDTTCLSPGNPPDWGSTNEAILGFGLQDPESSGYSLDSYSPMRLMPSDSDIIEYDQTGTLLQFSNISMAGGGFLGIPVADNVNYSFVSELLGVNRTYGFHLNIEPTLKVSITENTLNPLSLNVEVRGPGLALSHATLQYVLLKAYQPDDSDSPAIESISGTAETDLSGSTDLVFNPIIDGSQTAFSLIVHAQLGGLVGLGYYSHDTIENSHVIPFVEDFAQGQILLAHSYDVHQFPNPRALHFNTTFFGLTSSFGFNQFQMEGETSGLLNYGENDHTYAQCQIPPVQNGILFVMYRTGNDFGITMLPWGISTLGVSITFGGNHTGYNFVATEIRQVTISRVSYQVKLSVWRLGG